MHVLNLYLYGRVNARRDGQSEHLHCSKTGVKKEKEKKSELINRPSGNTPWRPRDFCRFSSSEFPASPSLHTSHHQATRLLVATK